MNLATPPPAYDMGDQAQMRRTVAQADQQNLKKGQDIAIQPGQRVILRASDGSQWVLAVATDGTLSTVAL